jgi:hypothetical protein
VNQPQPAADHERHIYQFEVERPSAIEWRATALYEVTGFMADHGCRAIIRAETFGDLEVLCVAERVRVTNTRAAEGLALRPERLAPGRREPTR